MGLSVGLLFFFQNCGGGFQLKSNTLSSLSLTNAKDQAVDMEWGKIRESFFTYMREAPKPEYLYPIYDVQLSTAPFLQYAIERKNDDWLFDLMDLYSIGDQHLKTVNSFLFYYPAHFSGSSFTAAYQEEIPLDRPFRLWVDSPKAGSSFSVGTEDVIASSQFLYPVSVLIWEFAREKKMNDPRVQDFVQKYWSVLVNDHLMRWIFNEGTLGASGSQKTAVGVSNSAGYGVFQLRGWGCNDGDFNHAERVEHLTYRRFGTDYFKPLYGTSFSGPKYCNSVWDADLWILAELAHALAAHQLNPTALPMSDDTFYRLKYHLQNGLKLVESRMTYKNVLDFNGNSVEAAVFDQGGFDGHPDYDYTADLNPTFPGYTVDGGAINRAPHPASNVGWDVSHARRLVQFFWTLKMLEKPLQLNFPTDRALKGLARQMAFGVFNGNFAEPSFTNFMDGTNGWYRVNYSGRANFGYPPSSWLLGGRSFLGGGYGFWREEEPALGEVLLSAVKNESFSDSWMKIRTFPSLPEEYFINRSE